MRPAANQFQARNSSELLWKTHPHREKIGLTMLCFPTDSYGGSGYNPATVRLLIRMLVKTVKIASSRRTGRLEEASEGLSIDLCAAVNETYRTKIPSLKSRFCVIDTLLSKSM